MDRFDNEMPDRARSVVKRLVTIMNGNNNLFNIIGGPIKIIEIIGIVVVDIEPKGCLINYNMDPTIGTDTVFATTGTALEINNDVPGVLYTWDGVMNNNLVATDSGVFLGTPANTDGSTDQAGQLICPAGSLELAAVVSTSATGTIDFFLRYLPLLPGARIEPV